MEHPTEAASFSKISLNQLTRFVHLKLKEDNFITWKNLMNPVIQKYKLRLYVDGLHPCPPQFTSNRNKGNGIENPLYLDWIDEHSTIIMWIHSTIFDSVIAYFSRSTTSHHIWTSIAERFARASSTHLIQLRTKLLSLTQGNKSIPSLINEIKSLSDQLAAAGEVISYKELVLLSKP
ncbi:uncharacterized protein LOC113343114 [Papaver somniferum]|uniref:uncharacterized protein LOC113343114 n=1 Tax=Papaver somniferum TaxID=3469 RepID=UPI000E6F7419|nr:uncharacterized protein LOC113343114 [Papaver somniferum]